MPAIATRTFSLPRSFRLFIAVKFVVLLAVAAVALAGNQQISTREAALLWSLFALLALWVILEINANRVTLDTDGVGIYHCFGLWRRFRWSDIEDLDCSPRIVSIAVRGLAGRVKLSRGARGFSLESYDELQERICELAMPSLLEAWDGVTLPVTYTYPGLTGGAITFYLVSLPAILFWPLVFAVSITGFWIEKLLFALMSLGLLSPFFVRDWRRMRGAVRLAPDHVERVDGPKVVIAWRHIRQLTIRDPAVSGYGWIVLASDDGREIRIPRSSRKSGAIRHLLAQRGTVDEDYDREQW